MSIQKVDMHNNLKVEIESQVITWTELLVGQIEKFKNCEAHSILNQGKALSEFIGNISHFAEFLTLSSLYLQKSNPNNKYLPIKLHLLAVLKALQVSIKNDDPIATHDLITEELRDNLIEWKITLIPHLNSKTNHTQSLSSEA